MFNILKKSLLLFFELSYILLQKTVLYIIFYLLDPHGGCGSGSRRYPSEFWPEKLKIRFFNLNLSLEVKKYILCSVWLRVSPFSLLFFFALKRNEAKQKSFRFLFASFRETNKMFFRFLSHPFASIFSLRFESLFRLL